MFPTLLKVGNLVELDHIRAAVHCSSVCSETNHACLLYLSNRSHLHTIHMFRGGTTVWDLLLDTLITQMGNNPPLQLVQMK